MSDAIIPLNLRSGDHANQPGHQTCGDAMPLSLMGQAMTTGRIPPCVLPMIGGVGAGMAAFAAIDWRDLTASATGAIAFAGIVGGAVVGGIIWALGQWDKVQIERRKKWEDANKDSLTVQIDRLISQHTESTARSEDNQQRMRATLHEVNNTNQRMELENHELRDELGSIRDQFLSVSKQLTEASTRLHEADIALNSAHVEMRMMRLELQKSTDALIVSERDRSALRSRLEEIERTQKSLADRTSALESVSSDGIVLPVTVNLQNPPSPTAPTLDAPSKLIIPGDATS